MSLRVKLKLNNFMSQKSMFANNATRRQLGVLLAVINSGLNKCGLNLKNVNNIIHILNMS